MAKVTVAIPTYNRAELLKSSLGSVLSQDYPDFRVVVLDNASTDDTKAVVRSFADWRVTYIRNARNLGILGNFNRAIEVNTSPYLNLFMDDDVMLPGFLRESVLMLEAYPRVGFSFALARRIDLLGQPLYLQDSEAVLEGVIDGREFLRLYTERRACTIYPSSSLMRVAALASVGSFESRHSEHTIDLNLYFRLAARFDVALIPKELIQVRHHPGQESASHWRSGQGSGELAELAELIDAVAYLLRSRRARDAAYREWLAERLLALNARRSEEARYLVPDLFRSWAASWAEGRQAMARDIEAVIPPEDSFILVDDDYWRTDEVFAGRRRIPFLERDGQYWGPPDDDATAIHELERLRRAGANFIVFAEPAFWWLEYYSGLQRYLRSTFRCLLENDGIAIFAL